MQHYTAGDPINGQKWTRKATLKIRPELQQAARSGVHDEVDLARGKRLRADARRSNPSNNPTINFRMACAVRVVQLDR